MLHFSLLRFGVTPGRTLYSNITPIAIPSAKAYRTAVLYSCMRLALICEGCSLQLCRLQLHVSCELPASRVSSYLERTRRGPSNGATLRWNAAVSVLDSWQSHTRP